ncbi:MAG TPA: hypothetical protein VD867_03535, partial [Burkholderiales bacterium]|nr:hypothetical protein [Burkholderiales bacterium]
QLQSEGSGGLSVSFSTQSQSSSAVLATPEARALGHELDQLRDSMKDQTRLEAATVAATAATGMSLSVGYVVWLLRGGALLSTFLSSLPAWRFIDPLPVLGRMDEDDDGDDADDSLESMVASGEGTPDDAPEVDAALGLADPGAAAPSVEAASPTDLASVSADAAVPEVDEGRAS